MTSSRISSRASAFGSAIGSSLCGVSDAGPDTGSVGAANFRSALLACFSLRALFLLVPRAEAALDCARGDTLLPGVPGFCLYATAVAGTTAAILPSSPGIRMTVVALVSNKSKMQGSGGLNHHKLEDGFDGVCGLDIGADSPNAATIGPPCESGRHIHPLLSTCLRLTTPGGVESARAFTFVACGSTGDHGRPPAPASDPRPLPNGPSCWARPWQPRPWSVPANWFCFVPLVLRPPDDSGTVPEPCSVHGGTSSGCLRSRNCLIASLLAPSPPRCSSSLAVSDSLYTRPPTTK